MLLPNELPPNELSDAAHPVAPVMVGTAVIGHVSEINGPDAEPCLGYVPTRHEFYVLARYWLETDLGLTAEFDATGSTGSREWRTQVYANQRLAKLEQVLGHDDLDRIIDEVGEAWEQRTSSPVQETLP